MYSGFVIELYTVAIYRSSDLDGDRVLFLQPPATDTGEFKLVTIAFYEVDPPDLGELNPHEKAVAVTLPARDFDAMYHLVQTEKPAFVEWESNHAQKLTYFAVAAGAVLPAKALRKYLARRPTA